VKHLPRRPTSTLALAMLPPARGAAPFAAAATTDDGGLRKRSGSTTCAGNPEAKASEALRVGDVGEFWRPVPLLERAARGGRGALAELDARTDDMAGDRPPAPPPPLSPLPPPPLPTRLGDGVPRMGECMTVDGESDEVAAEFLPLA